MLMAAALYDALQSPTKKRFENSTEIKSLLTLFINQL